MSAYTDTASPAKVKQDYHLAIGELVAYGALALPLLFIVGTTRFRQVGWLFLTAFVILQLVGSAITVADGTNTLPSSSATIITSVGISPLMFSILSILSNAVSGTRLEIDKRSKTLVGLIFHVAVIAGTAMYATGFINQFDSDSTSSGWGLTEAGITVLAVDWLVLLLPILVCSVNINEIPDKKALVLACSFANICLGVRIIYTLTEVYSDPIKLLTASLAVKLCLSILEGMLIVLAFDLAGLYSRKALANKTAGRASQRRAPRGQDTEMNSTNQYYQGK